MRSDRRRIRFSLRRGPAARADKSRLHGTKRAPEQGNPWLSATSLLRSPLEEREAVDRNPFAVPDSGGGERVLEVLRPFIAQEDPASSYRQVVYGNGQADFYLLDDGMMANHVSGTDSVGMSGPREPGGRMGHPVRGLPHAPYHGGHRNHLLGGLDEGVVVVVAGADLLRMITST